jgi:hypothetical protein
VAALDRLRVEGVVVGDREEVEAGRARAAAITSSGVPPPSDAVVWT